MSRADGKGQKADGKMGPLKLRSGLLDAGFDEALYLIAHRVRNGEAGSLSGGGDQMQFPVFRPDAIAESLPQGESHADLLQQ